jgi:hypothetical protein
VKTALVFIVAALLGGCGVVSNEPLFLSSQAGPHPLADGLWAASSPGCEVGPSPASQPLPECAVPFTINHGQLTLDLNALATAFGPSATMGTPPLATTSAVLLVDGDPSILQATEVAAAGRSTGGGPGTEPDAPPHPKPAYLALRPLGLNTRGEIDRAVIWPVLCPSDPTHAPGLVFVGSRCIAQTQVAVRDAARRLRPLTSVNVTWIRREAAPMAGGPPQRSLVLARRYLTAVAGEDPDPLGLHLHDPSRLAHLLNIEAPFDEAALAAAARQVTETRLPAYREAMAKVYAETMTEVQLDAIVSYSESKAGQAEVHKQGLVDGRIKQLAAATWPRFKARYEGVVCRQLKCPWRTQTGRGPSASPAPGGASTAAIKAADRYLNVVDLYQRPSSLISDEQSPIEDARAGGPGAEQDMFEGLFGEIMKEDRANPDVSSERRSQIHDEGRTAAAAALWPAYHRAVVELYAETFTVDELDGMTAHAQQQVDSGLSANPLTIQLSMRLIMTTQRAAMAETRALYCSKVKCPAPRSGN